MILLRNFVTFIMTSIYLKNGSISGLNSEHTPKLISIKVTVGGFRLLKFYINHGIVLGQIQNGIKIQPSAWIALYICVKQDY